MVRSTTSQTNKRTIHKTYRERELVIKEIWPGVLLSAQPIVAQPGHFAETTFPWKLCVFQLEAQYGSVLLQNLPKQQKCLGDLVVCHWRLEGEEDDRARVRNVL